MSIIGTMKLSQKLKMYLVSFFFTPFGLYWFFKYFRSEYPAVKREGYIALVITLLALVLSYVVVTKYLETYSDYFDLYKANMGVYSELGY